MPKGSPVKLLVEKLNTTSERLDVARSCANEYDPDDEGLRKKFLAALNQFVGKAAVGDILVFKPDGSTIKSKVKI